MSKTLEELEAELVQANKNIADINDRIKPLEKIRENYFKEQAKINDAILEIRKHDISYVLKSMNAYEEMRKMLPLGLIDNGYTPINHDYSNVEQCIAVSFDHNQEVTEEIIDFIENKWLPVSQLKELLVLNYEEDTLRISFDDEKVLRLYNPLYDHIPTERPKFEGNLREMLEYISVNYPNEKIRSNLDY